MSYAPPSQPATVGARSAVGAADNDAESTFRAAVDAMQIGGMGTLEVIVRLSNSGANAVIRMAYYSIDADGTETFEHMDAAQTATATAQSATANASRIHRGYSALVSNLRI